MNFEMIKYIHGVLKEKADKTLAEYKYFKYCLKAKYGDCWNDREITKEEQEERERLLKVQGEAWAMLERFEQVEWKC